MQAGNITGEQLTNAVNENTLLKLTPFWTRNIIANEAVIKKGKGVNAFFEKEKKSKTTDVPVVIVSGGPSLDKNIKLLPLCKDKAIIICVDSMLKKVMKLGIKPEFVVITDAEWGSLGNCFENLPMDTKDIALLADVYTNPEIIKKWNGEIYWYSILQVEGSPLTQIVDPEFTGKPIGKLVCGGCVSSVALSFASGALKCDPIIMIGQDCGWYDSELHHAKGFEGTNVNIGEELVEDIYGRPFFTTPVLKAYSYWFERIVCGRITPGFPSINGIFVNATQGGMVSKGWLIQTFQEAIDRYLKVNYNIKELLYPREKGGKDGKKRVNKKVPGKIS